jgi:hypothetical protein
LRRYDRVDLRKINVDTVDGERTAQIVFVIAFLSRHRSTNDLAPLPRRIDGAIAALATHPVKSISGSALATRRADTSPLPVRTRCVTRQSPTCIFEIDERRVEISVCHPARSSLVSIDRRIVGGCAVSGKAKVSAINGSSIALVSST